MRIKFRVSVSMIPALVGAAATLWAQAPTIPPSVASISPQGLERGTTVTVTIEGRSLSGARAVLFDSPGLSAKILGVRDLPQEVKVVRPGVDTGAAVAQGVKQEARIEISATPDVEAGIHRLRVLTPLGTSNVVVFDVGALPEIQEIEPNNSEGQRVEFPATLVGTIGWAGDVDTYQFKGQAGQEVVFQPVAAAIGSELESVLVLRGEAGKELARVGEFSRKPDSVLSFKLPADGTYSLSITDLEHRGGDGFFYRLHAGALPYVTEVFPLGLRAGKSARIDVKGANLGQVHQVDVEAPASADAWKTIPLRVKGAGGESFDKARLAVGEEPEVMEAEPNDDPAQAQRIEIPVTINGHIGGHIRDAHAADGARTDGTGKTAAADQDYFRFAAKKGQHLDIEVAAQRLGSPLDSVIEVLDAEGREIPQATIRSLVETSLTLNDRDSETRFFRVVSLADLHPNDYLLAGEELMQIDFVPDQPDADVRVKGMGRQRISLLNTSPQAHALNSPVYKVRIAEPGKEFPPNGLPVVQLNYRNDDGGPGYGADSRLGFTAPKDGEYLLHLKDVRGLEGGNFAYRLTVRETRKDFTLTATPSNPNVPRGGRVPIQVSVDRTLGYEGPIAVEAKGLPEGVTAGPATIAAGHDSDSTVVVLAAVADARDLAPAAANFQIVGRARVDGRDVVRVADGDEPLRVVSLMPPPDVVVAAEPHEVILDAGKETTVTLHVDRQNGFHGRVPCDVLNLPPGVTVVNFGLNGVLVPETDSSRTFTLRAEDWAWAAEQPIYVVADVESNSPTRHASLPLTLKVRPKKEMASAGREAASH